MSRRTARVNHIGLALVGLLLLLAGGATLARGLGLFGPPHVPVVSKQVGTYASAHPWFWPAVVVAALVIALLALRWLVLQARTDTIRYLSLEPDPRHGVTHLSARAAAAALEDDLTAGMRGEGARGAERVRATLTGAPTAPRLALAVVLPDDTDPATVRHGVHGAITRLRQSLETERLPATVRIHTIRTQR